MTKPAAAFLQILAIPFLFYGATSMFIGFTFTKLAILLVGIFLLWVGGKRLIDE